MRLKRLNPKLVILAGIGGASLELSEAFAALSSSNETRLNFASNVIAFIKENALDGVDIDWEYPTAGDKNNFVLLLNDLGEIFERFAYVLSVAVAPDKWRAEIFYDIPKISEVVGFINLMTYDFHGIWDETIGQHAQMFPHQNDSSYRRELNCAASITYWLSKGARADKLVLGVPIYGNTFVLSDSKQHKIGSPVNVTETKKTRGNLGYNEYCAIKSTKWIQHFDTKFRVYYATDGFSWFGFDSVQQVIRKANYAKSLHLGGIMVWSLDTDDIKNDCKQGRFPLVSSIFHELNSD